MSYGLALAAYALFALRMLVGWRGSVRASLLAAALITSALWAVRRGAHRGTQSRPALALLNVADVARYALWFAFTAACSVFGVGRDRTGGAGAPAAPSGSRGFTAIIAAALLACLLLSDGLPFIAYSAPPGRACRWRFTWGSPSSASCWSSS